MKMCIPKRVKKKLKLCQLSWRECNWWNKRLATIEHWPTRSVNVCWIMTQSQECPVLLSHACFSQQWGSALILWLAHFELLSWFSLRPPTFCMHHSLCAPPILLAVNGIDEWDRWDWELQNHVLVANGCWEPPWTTVERLTMPRGNLSCGSHFSWIAPLLMAKATQPAAIRDGRCVKSKSSRSIRSMKWFAAFFCMSSACAMCKKRTRNGCPVGTATLWFKVRRIMASMFRTSFLVYAPSQTQRQSPTRGG